jgi:hypothetical protein
MLTRCALASPLLSGFGLTTLTGKKIHTHPERWSEEFWMKIGISMLLVLAGGVFAGCVFMRCGCAPFCSLAAAD